MKPVTLDYHGMAIHATREAWFNATEIAEQQGIFQPIRAREKWTVLQPFG